jgi:Glycosyltransferase family 87
MRTFAKNFLALFAMAVVVIYFAGIFPRMQKGLDFADFYIGARIVHDGRGHELYDLPVQKQYLARYSGREGIYFNHPPFEAWIYLPFAMLPLAWAYTLWCVFQAILLIVLARLLERRVLRRWSWRVLVPIFLLFVPVLLDFLQGQDALLLLFLFTLAFVALEERREFAGGCLAGCGLFKFHLLLPALLPVFFVKSRKLAWGFVSAAVGLLLVSLWVSGWGVVAAYPRFLRLLGSLPLAGIHEAQKANLRGLFGVIMPGAQNAAVILTLLGSVLILGLALRSVSLASRNSSCARLAFANAMFAAVLISYHLSPHDLTILLLPMILLVDHLLNSRDIPRSTRFLLLLTLGLVFLPPLHLLLLRVHLYAYACIPILALFGLTSAEVRRISVGTLALRARSL